MLAALKGLGFWVMGPSPKREKPQVPNEGHRALLQGARRGVCVRGRRLPNP